MPKRKNGQPNIPGLEAKTSPSQLASVIKAARDIMRKDKGLSGDTDRLPQLTWIMFLKFIDDAEKVREEETALSGDPFKPAIAKPYRWRDWVTPADAFTGDDLINFINLEKTTLPNGKTDKAGLFPYLRSLRGENGGDRRDVIAKVFQDTTNRMLSGYILREVLLKVDTINFASTEQIHTLSALYESMLKEMRDAAGDAGEFYTPRAVVKFMVAATDPQLNETVLDPACGTGGFLVESFEHIRVQCKNVKDFARLQKGTLFGVEAKQLPHLLCEMNLMLHGLEFPNIEYGNALTVKIGEIGEKDRVDVILTNPPFGGEEETKILNNFPADRQTAETALLFLQLIMRKLRRTPRPGRAALIVPNGTLFGDGIAARIKEDLLKEFNLHTIVRLPNGVFAPYATIRTNLLFFDRSGPTQDIWYYEQALPEGVKNYTKTRPMQYEEFAPLLAWWNKREETEHAWKVRPEDILKYDKTGGLVSANLDIKNPNQAADLEHLPPAELAESIAAKERAIAGLMDEIEALLARGT